MHAHMRLARVCLNPDARSIYIVVRPQEETVGRILNEVNMLNLYDDRQDGYIVKEKRIRFEVEFVAKLYSIRIEIVLPE